MRYDIINMQEMLFQDLSGAWRLGGLGWGRTALRLNAGKPACLWVPPPPPHTHLPYPPEVVVTLSFLMVCNTWNLPFEEQGQPQQWPSHRVPCASLVLFSELGVSCSRSLLPYCFSAGLLQCALDRAALEEYPKVTTGGTHSSG